MKNFEREEVENITNQKLKRYGSPSNLLHGVVLAWAFIILYVLLEATPIKYVLYNPILFFFFLKMILTIYLEFYYIVHSIIQLYILSTLYVIYFLAYCFSCLWSLFIIILKHHLI